MGAKKPLINSTKPVKPIGKTINKSRAHDGGLTAKTGNTKVTVTRDRTSTPVKSLEKSTQNRKDKDASAKQTTSIPKTVGLTKLQAKRSSSYSSPARSPSPKKIINRSKNVEDKSKAISKVIKSLDIKISGFRNIAAHEPKVECKASISEIVKTKSRAASAKISPGPFGKLMKRSEDDSVVSQKVNTLVDTTSAVKLDFMDTKDTKNLVANQKKKIEKKQNKGKDVKETLLTNHSVDNGNKKQSEKANTVDRDFENVKFSDEKLQKSMDNNELVGESILIDEHERPSDEKSHKWDLGKSEAVILKKNPTKKPCRFNANTKKAPGKKGTLVKKVQNEVQASNEESHKNEKCEAAEQTKSLARDLITDQDRKEDVQHHSSKPISSTIAPNSSNNKDQHNSTKKDSSQGSKKTSLKKSNVISTSKPKSLKTTEIAEADDHPKKTNDLGKACGTKQIKSNEELSKGSTKPALTEAEKSSEEKATLNKEAEEIIGKQSMQKEFSKTCCLTTLQSPEVEMKTELKMEEVTKKTQSIQEGDTAKGPKSVAQAGHRKSPIKTDNKAQLVRERLQKKYMGNKTTTFKAFKAKKQTGSSKKGSMSPSKSPKREQPRSPSKKSVMKGDDIYDFNSESESEDNIKMNLIIETSMLSKLSKLAKSKERDKKNEEATNKQQKLGGKAENGEFDVNPKLAAGQKDDKKLEEIPEKIIQKNPTKDIESEKKEIEEELKDKKEAIDNKKGKEPPRKRKSDTKVSLNKTKEKVKNKDKDFSDEDDRPLQETKKLLDDAKQVDLDADELMKTVASHAGDGVKKDLKKTPKQSNVSKSKPPKKAPIVKRKARSESSNSDDSENDESDETSSSESCHVFGPKRHRMASLNALAKVQCLYENESRTAHELGLSKSSQAPKIRIIASGTSSDEDENAAKKLKKDESKEEPIKEEEEEESSAPEEENKRELRNAPGLRGMGKHWDFNDASSFESGHESDATFCHSDEKPKSKKRKIVKPKPIVKVKEKSDPTKSKRAAAQKSVKKKPRAQSPKNLSESSSEEENEKNQQRKRKREDTPEIKLNVTSKRMASLNASAIVAATYEVERHLDRNLDSDCSSFESIPDDVKSESPKKTDKDTPVNADLVEETPKENDSRPTSTSVVIVQDTDVTITGVYVNSSTGSSQEAYCKMQYRVQSSVTEERVLRPSSIDPPKSYTPLTALSSMRPPGTDGGQAISPEDLSLSQPQQTFQPTIVCRGDQPPTSAEARHQHTPPNAHIYAQHHHHHSQPPPHPLPGQEQMHHMHHQQSPPKYHHMYHHHHQQPPLAQPRCESPLRYPPGAYQNVQPPMPPPPNTISISGGGSSAFCAPSMQQPHHDSSGYYQPAGPLISQHVHPSTQSSNASIIPPSKQISSPLDPERDHHLSQIQQQSPAENLDNDVLITGGDLSTFRYSSQQPQQGQAQQSQALSLASSQPPPPQQTSPYSRQIHPMHYPPYPPTYYTPYAGDAMCYPPPYQHYYPKVYQSAPTYRRYSSYYPPGPPPPPNELYDPPLPPPNATQPQPSSGSQLIATGPSGPQHMDHYPGPPGFYAGYNPGGGECYPPRGMQPPYMEYPAPCPCPMQSCPKNVLTGPLIGSNNGNNSSSLNNNTTNSSNISSNTTSASTNISSITNSGANTANNNINTFNQQLKTNKGPVRMPNNNLIGHHEQAVPPPSLNLTSGKGILGKPIHHHHHPVTCKVELIEPLKSELKAGVISGSVISAESRKTGQYEETVVPPTSPSIYTVNDKLSEPEVVLSPARGSTGPQTMPERDESAGIPVNAIEVNSQAKLPQNHSSECENGKVIQTPTISRKARIGKTMAREMMYGAHAANPAHQLLPICGNHPCSHQTQLSHLPSHNIALDANNVTVSDSLQNVLTSEISRIKKEDIKIEEEDDVVILEEEVKEVKCEAEVVEVLDKRLDLDDYRECRDIDDELLVPRLQAKRMKILDNRSLCKKSPPNGYKSLIKQAEPKSYLCLATLKRDKSRHFRKCPRFAARGVIRKRKLVLTEQQKKRLATRKHALLMIEKNNQQKKKVKTLAKKAVFPVEREETPRLEKGICHRIEFETKELEADLNDSRGYFSEPDIRSSTSRNTKKTRSSETRSKSESKKSKCQKKSDIVTNKTLTSDETMPKLPENNMIINKLNASENEWQTSKKLAQSKSSKKKSKSKDYQLNNGITCFTIAQSVTSSSPVSVEPTVLDGRTTVGNSSTEKNNNNDKAEELMELTASSTASGYRSNLCGKRSRTRGSRFSRKRPKCRRYQMEVDNSIIPRKVNAVPKWNNGWSWLGEPFQAKIFLNSDDPLVIRTCYAAMQHIEGDIIRPRDCVLLKAGNKKNELPYVAKVAHLWENPEDGEMMMSLLWYYRPEHTEQGRQPNDCSDEVFASRHRDHNSVACIEDKCYVLTFSEYCRHRRRVRAAEEGIEGDNRIVPQLKIFSNIPPVTTNPEQVMFCQRVYEFRMKRLLKTPTN